MPIEDIRSSQRQCMLYVQPLTEQLNKKNKIYNLRNAIDWAKLEDEILALLNVKQFGRCRKSLRVMLGVSMLQAMSNGSDCYASEELQEAYIGSIFVDMNTSKSLYRYQNRTVRRFRNALGEGGYSVILKELLRVGIKLARSKKRLGFGDY